MAATLKDAFFWWVSKNIEPAVTTMIEDTTMPKQEALDALADLKDHVLKVETALDADEKRDALVHKMLTDLAAQVTAGADTSEIVASIADIKGHVAPVADRIAALDADANEPTPAPAPAPAGGGVVTGDTLPQ